MKKVKITVKRVACYKDLIKQYENPIEHACDMKVGQVFIANGTTKPDGFCDSAWESVSPFVFALSCGAENFYDGWMKNPKSAMISCNDGFRPVSFLLETMSEIGEKKTVVYIHGKGGNKYEALHYKPLFKECDVIGFDYKSTTPDKAKREFKEFIGSLVKTTGPVILIANSIGAYFSIISLDEKYVEKAFFISPIVDMEKLICGMMSLSGVTEEKLKKEKTVLTDFGETLSWDYLKYVREHPINWSVPTSILYGENDDLTSYEDIVAFSNKIRAKLTVMKDGEHWFHTKEQMAFIDMWITKGNA